MEEKRIFPRVKGDLEWLFVIQIDNNGKKIITETKDISCSGLRCKTDEYFAKESIVELILLLPLTERGLIFEKIKCTGKIVRCSLYIDNNKREIFETAFEFLNLEEKHHQKISKYITYVQEIAEKITNPFYAPQ